jgi:hypothetical protein
MMSRSNDRSYHESRAQDELERAKESTDPGVAGLHRELAALHRRRMMEIVHLGEPQRSPNPLIGGRRQQADR